MLAIPLWLTVVLFVLAGWLLLLALGLYFGWRAAKINFFKREAPPAPQKRRNGDH